MKFLKYLNFLLLCSSLSAQELVLDKPNEEQVVIEISHEDSFLTILEWIRDQFKTPKQIREENEMIAFCDDDELTIDIASLDKITISKNPKQKKDFRNYNIPLDQSEKDNIEYILTTLYNHTFLTLAPYRSKLKKAGKNVDHVHPFRFLECIFTSPALINCVNGIKGKMFIWGEFLNGITTSLKEETKKKNVLVEQLNDFASILGVDAAPLYDSYNREDWEEFVNVLISIVPLPAKADSDRYNI